LSKKYSKVPNNRHGTSTALPITKIETCISRQAIGAQNYLL